MTRLLFLLILFISVLFITKSVAQDKIIKRTGEEINGKVREVGDDEIKYTLPEYGDVQFGIDKNDVERIIFANGSVLNVLNTLKSTELYATQKHNALKTNFLSVLFGNLNLTYEHLTGVGRSQEMTLGLIGLGRNPYENSSSSSRHDLGVFLKYGFKFIQSPDFYLKGMRYAHVLKGNYVSVEPAFCIYNSKYENEVYYYPSGSAVESGQNTIVKGSVMINLGKQWINGDAFVVDMYGGIGLGFTNEYEENGGMLWPYGFMIVGQDIPLSLNFGFRIGFLLPNKKVPAN